MIFRLDQAIECFERVLKLTRQIPDVHLELAVLYERRHRVVEAHALIEDCLRAAPDYLEAQLFKARLLRRMKDAAGADKLFRELAANEQAHLLMRAQTWNEVAQKLDQEGDFECAMNALLKCKELLKRDEKLLLEESEALQGHVRNLAETLTPTHFQRWAEAAKVFPRHKQAVLASFPRTGTTLLEQVLDSHPGLVSSDEREAFSRDIFPAIWRTPTTPLPTAVALDAVPQDRLTAQRERYFAYIAAALNEPIDDRMHLDKNPNLTPLLPGML